jgi:hypothetical protein
VTGRPLFDGGVVGAAWRLSSAGAAGQVQADGVEGEGAGLVEQGAEGLLGGWLAGATPLGRRRDLQGAVGQPGQRGAGSLVTATIQRPWSLAACMSWVAWRQQRPGTVATALLAFSIATAARAVTRRVVPALATGLVAVLVVALALNLAAQSWWPHARSPSPTRPASQAPAPAWTTESSQAATVTAPAATCRLKHWTGSAPEPAGRRWAAALPATASSGSTATSRPAAPGSAP